jgi:DNA-binding NarL/FixJ family response regulator
LPEESYGLTKKELEILALMVDGMSYKMISQKCFISFETVKTHIRNIYAKMKVSTMTEAVVLALRKRIV